MKSLIIALSFALAASATFARTTHPAAPAASDAAAASTTVATTQPGTPQRSKMKTCNADAKTKDVHGADRRAFMKQCLSGKAKPAAAS
jgi:psiF repeat